MRTRAFALALAVACAVDRLPVCADPARAGAEGARRRRPRPVRGVLRGPPVRPGHRRQQRPAAERPSARLPAHLRPRGPGREAPRRHEHDLPLGVDHEDVHRHRDHAAARSRAAVAGRPDREVPPRASRGLQPVRPDGGRHDPHADEPHVRVPNGHVAMGR